LEHAVGRFTCGILRKVIELKKSEERQAAAERVYKTKLASFTTFYAFFLNDVTATRKSAW
jgi:hypothetical protein